MSWLLILGVAAVTFGSRLLGLVATPEVQGRVKALLEALPAPLFAALAAASLAGPGQAVPPALLGAFGGAVAATFVRRSLLAALAGGAGGFVLGGLLGGA